MQVEVPSVGLYLPSAHGCGVTTPGPQKEPLGHMMLVLTLGQYEPLAHAMHDIAPRAIPYVPNGQVVQIDSPVWLVYVPAAQGGHVVIPATAL